MWCCIYIPYLPLSLWEVIHAIMPFIVGVAREHKEFVRTLGVSIDINNDFRYQAILT